MGGLLLGVLFLCCVAVPAEGTRLRSPRAALSPRRSSRAGDVLAGKPEAAVSFRARRRKPVEPPRQWGLARRVDLRAVSEAAKSPASPAAELAHFGLADAEVGAIAVEAEAREQTLGGVREGVTLRGEIGMPAEYDAGLAAAKVEWAKSLGGAPRPRKLIAHFYFSSF